MARPIRLGDLAAVAQGMATSGRGAGTRPGNWRVRMASVGDIQDDRLDVYGLATQHLEQNAKTEKHLLQADDLLVAARSTVAKAALVPPLESRTTADATLLVVRPREVALGPYLWWYLTSRAGRQQVQSRMAGSTTLLSLSVASLAELEVPCPEARELYRIAELVHASERAYAAATEAARLRRTLFREAIIGRLLQSAGLTGAREWR